MPATTPKNNLAARMGRWSADHWKTATFGWLAFVLVAFALGGMAGTKSRSTRTPPGRASPAAWTGSSTPASSSPAGESVLDPEPSRSRRPIPAFTAAVDDVVARLSKLEAVQNVRSPLDRQRGPDLANGHSALVEFEIRGAADEAADEDRPGPRRGRRRAGRRTRSSSSASSATPARSRRVETAFADDLGEGRAPVAADHAGHPRDRVRRPRRRGHPAAARPHRRVRDLRPRRRAQPRRADGERRRGAIVLLIGLAVGVDYSLFYLRREREERAAGPQRAGRARGRSRHLRPLGAHLRPDRDDGDGRHVPDRRPRSSRRSAIATILVVAIAMLGSLTVLPALLSRLGDSVDRARVPLLGRLRRDDGEGRIWGAIVDRVLRRPVLSVVLAGGLLLALAIPALQLRMVQPGPDTFPQSLPAVQTYNRMQQAFPGTALPANVVVKAAERERAAAAGGDRAARAAGARERPHARADHGRRQQGRDGREHHRPDRRQGHRRRLERVPGRPARRDRADDRRRAPGRRGRRHGRRRPSGRTAPTR